MLQRQTAVFCRYPGIIQRCLRRMSDRKDSRSKQWNLQPTTTARNTFNAIRAIIDTSTAKPNPEYETIKLAAGDPAVYPGFEPPSSALEAIRESVNSEKFCGYQPAHGNATARKAVAELYSTPTQSLSSDDVLLTCGCNGALDICFRGLANPGDNILIPSPGFIIYTTMLDSYGIGFKEYRLLPEQNWDVDLYHLESLFDSKTKAIVVNCPSNPCGSVYTKEHKLEIIKLAAKHCVPIIADEVYGGMVFADIEYKSFGALSTDVPILSCGSLAKRYLVPGWRLGWIVLYDSVTALSSEVRESLVRMCQVILGPCAVIQGAVPKILKETPTEFFQAINRKLGENAILVFDRLSKVPGLTPIMPRGSMYTLVGIDQKQHAGFKDDYDFTERLYSEMSVRCIPGKAFRAPGFFRIVLCASQAKLIEACDRLSEFCARHCTSL
ncbi:tyrosine aminotransferase-like [Corticium candelabrum]|uniref:tyrosine aminotransferase-like n=1 Tax=Corticium candelabrum TaxID=121492 RepID=UPI002E269356|nr:tyrosine aminotransferase-like [Corticium candelabrum]